MKSVGLFPTLRLRRQAQRAGYDDVLFTGADGDLLEGGTWNIGLVRDGEVVWPGGEVLAARPGNSCGVPPTVPPSWSASRTSTPSRRCSRPTPPSGSVPSPASTTVRSRQPIRR
ncbi:aminotransferase class IV [Actinomadura keratinilytica]